MLKAKIPSTRFVLMLAYTKYLHIHENSSHYMIQNYKNIEVICLIINFSRLNQIKFKFPT